MSLLEVKDLKKYFSVKNGTLHAVDGLTFNIEEGKTLGMVGESGCGKSTCGRAILRLHEPTSGEIFFEGKNIVTLNKNEMRQMRQEMQIIFQDPFASLNPRRTVSEIIADPINLHKLYKTKKEVDDKVKELMDTVGLAERLVNAYPHELDGGRRQRIGIARALALNPKFIVCDEPVSALDVSIQAQILNLLERLQKERKLTYIFITHDLSVVHYFAHDILVMYMGKMVEKAEAVELFRNTLHPYTKALLSAVPVPNIHNKKKRILLKGEITSPINPKPGCRFAPRCPIATKECFEVSPEFREVGNEHFVACHHV
ncbi:peptide/nickel transport system ATP-binding protein [Peptoniphilus koenoeneniae]|uniref:Peptide/nickel transport system ATP-binding protein n=1 Tax=Peptoniphilus koenoeneniae TaxID=507751 RepID=A0ABU0AW74_9FIRM|nr:MULTISPECIES: oligopeptide/dipeptide ABC transporter ATP-binding protein [Peptoniphilus]ERT60110.1 oligopeptide/dipeptide transporter, C-terminal domain protein [Peptoniphilus sp. BV3C26]MDQ0275521.1 peptide/nickel transport system ATP-binding protein [Peptoniphilus koenoeneniae]